MPTSPPVAGRLRSSPMADMRSVEWPMRKALLIAGFAASTSFANAANVFAICSALLDDQADEFRRHILREGRGRDAAIAADDGRHALARLHRHGGIFDQRGVVCVCTSMKPGATTLPAALISLSDLSVPGAPMAAIANP